MFDHITNDCSITVDGFVNSESNVKYKENCVSMMK